MPEGMEVIRLVEPGFPEVSFNLVRNVARRERRLLRGEDQSGTRDSLPGIGEASRLVSIPRQRRERDGAVSALSRESLAGLYVDQSELLVDVSVP